jgi:electron transport complex protein RnfG
MAEQQKLKANSFVKCSVALALITFGMLLLVSGIEINTADKIERSLLNHKQSIVNDILRNMDYDCLVNVKLATEMPVDLTSSVTVSSIDAIMANGLPSAVLIEVVTNSGYNGIIRLLVAVRADGVVLGSRVIEHHETPGLGDKIEAHRSDWIDSFIDKSLNNVSSNGWRVKRDDGEFDQFTGATITPRAVVTAVHQTLLFVRNHNEMLFR